MEKKNNLPMVTKEKLPLQRKRQIRRIKENAKRFGRIILDSGIAFSGVVISTIGGPIALPIGIGTYIAFATKVLYNTQFKKEKGTQFVTRKNLKGEMFLFQDSLDISGLSRMRGFEPHEKGAVMGIQMLMGLQNYKRQYQDMDLQTETSRDGRYQVYPQKFKTKTHGINIKTIEALDKLGYIQIDKNQKLNKSILFWEKVGFGQYKKAREALTALLTKNQEKVKENEVQMSEIVFRLTDKTLDLEEIYQNYQELRTTKGNNPDRKPIRRIGSIIEALKDKNIDIETDELGILKMNYKAQESFATRVMREHEILNKSKKYREGQRIIVDNSNEQSFEKSVDTINQEKVVQNDDVINSQSYEEEI